MEPKNAGARKKAFLNFLLLFILSTAIIVLLSFFSTRTPLKHNENLEKQVVNFEREKAFSTSFMNQMIDIVNLIDSASKDTKPDFLYGQANEKIIKLEDVVIKDSVNNKMLFQYAVLTLRELQAAKKQNRDFSGKNTDDRELQNQVATLQAQLYQCQLSSIKNHQ